MNKCTGGHIVRVTPEIINQTFFLLLRSDTSCAFRASTMRLDFLRADLAPCQLYVCGVPGSKYSQGLRNVFVQQRKAPDSVSFSSRF